MTGTIAINSAGLSASQLLTAQTAAFNAIKAGSASGLALVGTFGRFGIPFSPPNADTLVDLSDAKLTDIFVVAGGGWDLVGGDFTSPSTAQACVQAYGVDGIKVRQGVFHNWNSIGAGVLLRGCKNALVDSCEFTGSTGDGVDIQGGTDGEIRFNRFADMLYVDVQHIHTDCVQMYNYANQPKLARWKIHHNNMVVNCQLIGYYGDPAGAVLGCENIEIAHNFGCTKMAQGAWLHNARNCTVSDNKFVSSSLLPKGWEPPSAHCTDALDVHVPDSGFAITGNRCERNINGLPMAA